MGLDAKVYCNCFETAQLNEQPPFPHVIAVEPDGGLNFNTQDPEVLLDSDEWLWHRACAHESGILLHHRIGNMAQVGLLRTELSREADRFPVVLKQVLYNGMHAGDYLSLEDVSRLRSELLALNTFVCSDLKNKKYVEWFYQQMRKLAEASLTVG